jgi:hypothetical protein
VRVGGSLHLRIDLGCLELRCIFMSPLFGRRIRTGHFDIVKRTQDMQGQLCLLRLPGGEAYLVRAVHRRFGRGEGHPKGGSTVAARLAQKKEASARARTWQRGSRGAIVVVSCARARGCGLGGGLGRTQRGRVRTRRWLAYSSGVKRAGVRPGHMIGGACWSVARGLR